MRRRDVRESLVETILSNIAVIFAGWGSISSTTSGIKELKHESTHVTQGQQAQSKQTVSASGELSSLDGTFLLYGFHFLKVKPIEYGEDFSWSKGVLSFV